MFLHRDGSRDEKSAHTRPCVLTRLTHVPKSSFLLIVIHAGCLCTKWGRRAVKVKKIKTIISLLSRKIIPYLNIKLLFNYLIPSLTWVLKEWKVFLNVFVMTLYCVQWTTESGTHTQSFSSNEQQAECGAPTCQGR